MIPYNLHNDTNIDLVCYAFDMVYMNAHILKYGVNDAAAFAKAIPVFLSQLSFISPYPPNNFYAAYLINTLQFIANISLKDSIEVEF